MAAGFEFDFADDDDDEEPPRPPSRRAAVGRPTAVRRAARRPAEEFEADMDMDAVVAAAAAVAGEDAPAQQRAPAPAWPSKMGSTRSAIQNSPSSSAGVLGMRAARAADFPVLADSVYSGQKRSRHDMTKTAAAAAEAAINKPLPPPRSHAPATRRAASAAPAPAQAGPPPLTGAVAPAAAAAAAHVFKPAVGAPGASQPAASAGEAQLASFVRPRPPPLRLKALKPSKIRKGDFVVHSAYGIGKFEGEWVLLPPLGRGGV
jgi:hypothetical protein